MAGWGIRRSTRHGVSDAEHVGPWPDAISSPACVLRGDLHRPSSSTGMALPCRIVTPAPRNSRERVEDLCDAGVHIFIVSGTHMENVDGQLRARPDGRGHLFLCRNRGSEVFQVTGEGAAAPGLVKTVSADEAFERSTSPLHRPWNAFGSEDSNTNRGQPPESSQDRPHPGPGVGHPKKADIGRLLDAVMARLGAVDMADLSEVIDVAARAAARRRAVRSSDYQRCQARGDRTDRQVRLGAARRPSGWRSRGITGELILDWRRRVRPIGRAMGSDSFMMVDTLFRGRSSRSESSRAEFQGRHAPRRRSAPFRRAPRCATHPSS